MDRQTLRDWVHRYNADGLAGLENRCSPGAPGLLNDAQQAALAAKVEAGPDVAHDGVVRWRRIDLARWLEAEFGVEIKERTVGSYLRKLGFRRISSRPAHPERDSEAQETFKKTSPTWQRPLSRKVPRESRSKSGSRMRQGLASRAP